MLKVSSVKREFHAKREHFGVTPTFGTVRLGKIPFSARGSPILMQRTIAVVRLSAVTYYSASQAFITAFKGTIATVLDSYSYSAC